MRIQLKQAEVEEAINLWLGQQGINLTDKAVSISFSITRSPTSILADVDIDNPGTGVTNNVAALNVNQAYNPIAESDEPEAAGEEAPVEVAGKSLFG